MDNFLGHSETFWVGVSALVTAAAVIVALWAAFKPGRDENARNKVIRECMMPALIEDLSSALRMLNRQPSKKIANRCEVSIKSEAPTGFRIHFAAETPQSLRDALAVPGVFKRDVANALFRTAASLDRLQRIRDIRYNYEPGSWSEEKHAQDELEKAWEEAVKNIKEAVMLLGGDVTSAPPTKAAASGIALSKE